MTSLQKVAAETSEAFLKSYGRPPRWMVAAPGRVNVIGEHTDYNDGFVLPMAIEHYAVMAADRPADGQAVIQIRATSGMEPLRVDLSAPVTPGEPSWGNYPRGVIAGCLARGLNPGGLDVLLHSTVPIGGGLSSSAALEVATATLMETVTGQTMDPVEKALLCQKAEHDFAGMPCGIMDQFISVMGRPDHLLLLDCRSRQTELVPMSDRSVSLLIINTNVKHALTGGGYAQRRLQCETASKNLDVPSLRDATMDMLEQARGRMDEVVFRRARHVIGEISRTLQAAAAVRASDWPRVGSLMGASHASLRDDYDVSCVELDAVVDIARGIGQAGGIYGCRMTGGGFGGCAVALVKAGQVEEVSRQMAADYKARTGIEATIFVSRPAAGATVLQA